MGAPGHEGHVVAGLGELVRERGGVRGDAALVRVGGADQRDLHARLVSRPDDQVGQQRQASR